MNNTQNVVNSKLKNKISDFVLRIGDGTGKVANKFLLDMIYGLVKGNDIKLSNIGRNLKENTSIKHTEKRISRNLGNFDIYSNIQVKENILIQSKSRINLETVITLDGGDINKSGALKMENLKKIHDGSKGTIELGYCINSIVATNIENKRPINIPLNLNLYSTKAKGFESENRESVKSVDEVIKIIGNNGIWVMDRGYDRSKNIIQELLDRSLTFIIRAVGTRDIIRIKDSKKMRLKTLAENIKVRKRIINFDYKTNNLDKNGDKIVKKISGMVGYEKVSIPGIKEELTICVLKKYSGEIAMIMITNMNIKDNDGVVKVFAKYSCRWGVEDTYKYMKQEFGLENIMLKNYKSLQNIMTFLLGAMNFVSEISKNLGKYFCNFIIKEARVLNEKRLKYKEHAIIAGIRQILTKNSIGIREFLRKKIEKFDPGLQTQLFDNIANPYENMGKL